MNGMRKWFVRLKMWDVKDNPLLETFARILDYDVAHREYSGEVYVPYAEAIPEHPLYPYRRYLNGERERIGGADYPRGPISDTVKSSRRVFPDVLFNGRPSYIFMDDIEGSAEGSDSRKARKFAPLQAQPLCRTCTALHVEGVDSNRSNQVQRINHRPEHGD